MTTPTYGVRSRSERELPRRHEWISRAATAVGSEKSLGKQLRRPAEQADAECTTALASDDIALDVSVDTGMPNSRADRTHNVVVPEYLPVTTTYDEMPRFELEEEAVAYEPVTTVYRPLLSSDGEDGEQATGRAKTKIFGSMFSAAPSATECEPRAGELAYPHAGTGVARGGGDFGAANRDDQTLSGRVTQPAQPKLAFDVSSSVSLRRRMPRAPDVLRGLSKRAANTDGRIFAAAALVVTLVVFSWMILLVR